MSTDSTSFFLLDDRIQRYIWKEGWTILREVQEKSIPPILDADKDVIIAAQTASGKTEAAFLPALTRLLTCGNPSLIVYISPVKALINDQFDRIGALCEHLKIPVWAWHGDITASTKSKFLKNRTGVLLITPESLEAILCRRGTSVRSIFEYQTYFIIDELHSFIGSERGKQLQSLMHRVELAINKSIPRIGLSATLGDISLGAKFLRSASSENVLIVDISTHDASIRIGVKGFENLAEISNDQIEEPTIHNSIAEHIFKNTYGSNNLVFPNAKSEVERYTFLLNEICRKNNLSEEYWPHHGSLSKEVRFDTELELKRKTRFATAICTNTLELGIDIGAIKSVIQIGSPPSVSSLRQRLGRSGRRPGESSILRCYCTEMELSAKSDIETELRLSLVEAVSMIQLLLENWCEPPIINGLYLSTLVHQVLSIVTQMGGVSMSELYKRLCSLNAPFDNVSKEDFIALVHQLGNNDLLIQDSSGILLLGTQGERRVNHYSFYAVFVTPEEFRLIADGKVLGQIPIQSTLEEGQNIIFAGKTWVVEQIDESSKVIYVTHTVSGKTIRFSSDTLGLHTLVRQRMRKLLESTEIPEFLTDEVAIRFLKEGRKAYLDRHLSERFLIDVGKSYYLFTWKGDSTNQAIQYLLNLNGYKTFADGPGIFVMKTHLIDEILSTLYKMNDANTSITESLLDNVQNLCKEKWDWALPRNLLQKSYMRNNLDFEGAFNWIKEISNN